MKSTHLWLELKTIPNNSKMLKWDRIIGHYYLLDTNAILLSR